jgi:hypothetical protein
MSLLEVTVRALLGSVGGRKPQPKDFLSTATTATTDETESYLHASSDDVTVSYLLSNILLYTSPVRGQRKSIVITENNRNVDLCQPVFVESTFRWSPHWRSNGSSLTSNPDIESPSVAPLIVVPVRLCQINSLVGFIKPTEIVYDSRPSTVKAWSGTPLLLPISKATRHTPSSDTDIGNGLLTRSARCRSRGPKKRLLSIMSLFQL